jgi:hypothetical protein
MQNRRRQDPGEADSAGLGIGTRQELDIFWDVNLHIYEHMKFEFVLARPHIMPGGLLLADDALWNSAFAEFAQSVSSPASAIIRGVGVLKT